MIEPGRLHIIVLIVLINYSTFSKTSNIPVVHKDPETSSPNTVVTISVSKPATPPYILSEIEKTFIMNILNKGFENYKARLILSMTDSSVIKAKKATDKEIVSYFDPLCYNQYKMASPKIKAAKTFGSEQVCGESLCNQFRKLLDIMKCPLAPSVVFDKDSCKCMDSEDKNPPRPYHLSGCLCAFTDDSQKIAYGYLLHEEIKNRGIFFYSDLEEENNYTPDVEGGKKTYTRIAPTGTKKTFTIPGDNARKLVRFVSKSSSCRIGAFKMVNPNAIATTDENTEVVTEPNGDFTHIEFHNSANELSGTLKTEDMTIIDNTVNDYMEHYDFTVVSDYEAGASNPDEAVADVFYPLCYTKYKTPDTYLKNVKLYGSKQTCTKKLCERLKTKLASDIKCTHLAPSDKDDFHAKCTIAKYKNTDKIFLDDSCLCTMNNEQTAKTYIYLLNETMDFRGFYSYYIISDRPFVKGQSVPEEQITFPFDYEKFKALSENMADEETLSDCNRGAMKIKNVIMDP